MERYINFLQPHGYSYLTIFRYCLVYVSIAFCKVIARFHGMEFNELISVLQQYKGLVATCYVLNRTYGFGQLLNRKNTKCQKKYTWDHHFGFPTSYFSIRQDSSQLYSCTR